MNEIVPWIVTVVAVAAVLAGLAWLAARTRRRGVGREIMGPVDMIYRPHTHQVNREIRTQEERMVARPSPDEPAHDRRS